MAVSIATIKSDINALLNFATTYTATPTSARASEQWIADNALTADGMVVEAIGANPANGRWNAFSTTASVAQGGALPSRIGTIGSVVIGGKAATEWPETEIEFDRGTGLTMLPARYAIVGNKLFHNQGASSATVEYFTYSRTSACQAPDEYYGQVLCGTAWLCSNIEGEDVASASHYAQLFQEMLAAIRAGQAPSPFVSHRQAA